MRESVYVDGHSCWVWVVVVVVVLELYTCVAFMGGRGQGAGIGTHVSGVSECVSFYICVVDCGVTVWLLCDYL